MLPRVEVMVLEERNRERDLKCAGREAKTGLLYVGSEVAVAVWALGQLQSDSIPIVAV